jgi:hypothetical protein
MGTEFTSDHPSDSYTIYEADSELRRRTDAGGHRLGRVETESSRPIDGLWIIEDTADRPAPRPIDTPEPPRG